MPERRLISSGSPFEKSWGYSRAVVDGDMIFVSGTTGYDYATMTMPEGVEAQARNIYRTIASVLAEAGANLADIVRLQTFVTDAKDCDAALNVQGELFAAIRPAASIYVVTGMARPEMRIEIEATAKVRRNAM
jgi:enamine deaminase RidA (YjgF/YER057c/UK114 family)